MRAANRVAPLLGAPLLSAALLGTIAVPTDAASSAPTPTPSVASIPAAVQPLVVKIEAQQVNSERYSTTERAAGTVTLRRRGKTRKVYERQTKTAVGEASLAPLLGKVFAKGSSGALSEIGIGSTLYAYAPSFAGKRSGRPWLRTDGVSAAALFPYHGQSNPQFEVNAGGSGPYAELIDLLATANGAVSVVGPATVDGQATTELTASVRPLALIKGAANGTDEQTAQLDVFVTEAGLPLRVTRSQQLGAISTTQTIDVLATNVAVSVKPPPKRETIGGAALEKLFAPNGGGK